ncbi:MAG: hypothetical protein ACRD2G_17185 [Terriglobia bacterium]
MFERYFLTDLKMGEAFAEVLERLLLTMNGLNSDIQLRVVEKISVSSMNVGEAVAKVAEISGVSTEKPLQRGQNLIPDLLTGKQTRYGDIFLEKEMVNKTGMSGAVGYKPVKVLIHEATHKFAGTIDYWYFPERDGGKSVKFSERDGDKSVKDGDNIGGYLGSQAGTAKKFSDPAQGKDGPVLARMNADSFAWFCYWVGSQSDLRTALDETAIKQKTLISARGPGGIIG